MADSLAQQKKRLHKMMGQMQKKYGITKLPYREPDFELFTFLIFREGWDYRKATRVASELLEKFVDWNEIRVSFVRELCESLESLKCKNVEEKVTRLRDSIQAYFEEYNRLQKKILYEKEFEEIRVYFSQIKPLGLANAYIFLQCLQDSLDEAPAKSSKTLVLSTEGLRMGIRLGLIKKTGSLNVGRKEFTTLLEPNEYFLFHNLFVRHADLVCLVKNPLCEECFLNKDCGFCKI